MSREDTHSRTEVGAARAEFYRAQRTGEDTDAGDLDTPRSTWTPENVPQHVRDDVANAPTDAPPF